MAESVSGGSVDGVGGREGGNKTREREGKTQMEGERERQRRKEERNVHSHACTNRRMQCRIIIDDLTSTISGCLC